MQLGEDQLFAGEGWKMPHWHCGVAGGPCQQGKRVSSAALDAMHGMLFAHIRCGVSRVAAARAIGARLLGSTQAG